MDADEGRGKPAKRRGERASTRRSPDIRMGQPGSGYAESLVTEHIGYREGTGGTETSQYPEERKVLP